LTFFGASTSLEVAPTSTYLLYVGARVLDHNTVLLSTPPYVVRRTPIIVIM
jgi:hypothetical protein